MNLEILKMVGYYALWVLAFNCITYGGVGAIIILRDAFKQGAYTPKIVFFHCSITVVGIFIIKELLK